MIPLGNAFLNSGTPSGVLLFPLGVVLAALSAARTTPNQPVRRGAPNCSGHFPTVSDFCAVSPAHLGRRVASSRRDEAFSRVLLRAAWPAKAHQKSRRAEGTAGREAHMLRSQTSGMTHMSISKNLLRGFSSFKSMLSILSGLYHRNNNKSV